MAGQECEQLFEALGSRRGFAALRPHRVGHPRIQPVRDHVVERPEGIARVNQIALAQLDIAQAEAGDPLASRSDRQPDAALVSRERTPTSSLSARSAAVRAKR